MLRWENTLMRVSMRLTTILLLIATGLMGLSLSTTNRVAAQAAPTQYVLVGSGGSLPLNLEALVASVGGGVVERLDEIGVAIVESSEPNFAGAAATISGLDGIEEDRVVPLTLPDQGDSTVVESLDTENATWEGGALDALNSKPCTNPPSGDCNPGLAKFFWAQWDMRTIGAPMAWSAGVRGDPRVKVAVIDTGIDYAQQEFQRVVNGKLVSIVDPVLSKSFFKEALPPGAPPYLDVTGHGTHVAGIIAAEGVSVAGVAPGVTLLAIKVAGRSGFATYAAIIAAIKYAADVGADVINMSFGDVLARGGRENAQLMAALNRAVNYAHSKGALLVASAGNSGTNWDNNKDLCPMNPPLDPPLTINRCMKVPAQLPHVVAVSATGPQFQLSFDSMGVIPNAAGLEQRYTDYGMTLVTFAAPGGSVTRFVDAATKMPLDRVLSACARFTPGVNCSSGRANIFMVGTSMAAAHVSGVAALIDSAAGGALTGDQIIQILKQSADHIGRPGKDAWYGFGRINAHRAVTGN